MGVLHGTPTATSNDHESLPTLQNLIKRDPDGYKDDFERRLRHFQSIIDIQRSQPGAESKELVALYQRMLMMGKEQPAQKAGPSSHAKRKHATPEPEEVVPEVAEVVMPEEGVGMQQFEEVGLPQATLLCHCPAR